MRTSGFLLFLALSLSLAAGEARVFAAPGGVSVERAVKHYAQVERELLAADTAHLSPAQRSERARLISELRDYRESRDFDPSGRPANCVGQR